jgi:hypothetical protein
LVTESSEMDQPITKIQEEKRDRWKRFRVVQKRPQTKINAIERILTELAHHNIPNQFENQAAKRELCHRNFASKWTDNQHRRKEMRGWTRILYCTKDYQSAVFSYLRQQDTNPTSRCSVSFWMDLKPNNK